LIEHGAIIIRPLPVDDLYDPYGYSYSTRTVAQYLLYAGRYVWNGFLYGEGRKKPQNREMGSYRQLVSLVAPIDQQDECHCQCIEAGCHTMKIYFEQLWERASGNGICRHQPYLRRILIKSSSVPSIAEKNSNFLQDLTLDLSRWDRVAELAGRYFTFEALELQHTCCEVPWKELEWTEEEILEIENEYRHKLNLLELLLEDFQIAYYNFENQDRQQGKFTDFLTVEWAPRIKRKAEEIGVRCQPVSEDEDNKGSEDLDDWLGKMDEIMPAETLGHTDLLQ
ncbi:hypothetical protein F4678DRAFT_486032, partial [Xylaria arbuscula]